jgi:hypothetical protein
LQVELRKLRLIEPCVARVRREMSEPGFTLVDTPSLFDESLSFRLRKTRLVMESDGKRWWKYPQLARYGCWLESLLSKALPEESLSLASLEYRHEPAGSVDEEVDRLHADGSYLRSVFTLYGPATIYREGDEQRSVPEGQTLLMTALDRARALHVPCTLHRRPGAGPERAVIVCSFEPRQEAPQRANVYCQVVSSHRPRCR